MSDKKQATMVEKLENKLRQHPALMGFFLDKIEGSLINLLACK